MGFCFYNSVAIAAKYAQSKHDMKKLVINVGLNFPAIFTNYCGILSFDSYLHCIIM